MSKASIYFSVNDIDGKHGTKELKRELDTLGGVLSVSVNNKDETIAVDYDPTGVKQEQIKNKIEGLGYEISQMHRENELL